MEAATLAPVQALLVIPWFKAEAFQLPLPLPLPILERLRSGPFDADFRWLAEVPIQPFGLLVMLGVLVGTRVGERFARHEGIDPRWVADFMAHATILGLFIAAPVLNTVFYHPERILAAIEDPREAGHLMTGISSYGGFIGVIAAGFLWRWRRKLPLLPMADIIAFGFPFGWFFGRMGCAVVHDHPGRPSSFFLAIDNYEVGVPPFVARHDLGLYEVIWSAGVALIFLALVRMKRPRGLFVALLPMLYGPVRFLLDFLRTEPNMRGDVRYLGLTPGHYASIAILVASLVMLRWVLTHESPAIPSAMRLPEDARGGTPSRSVAGATA